MYAHIWVEEDQRKVFLGSWWFMAILGLTSSTYKVVEVSLKLSFVRLCAKVPNLIMKINIARMVIAPLVFGLSNCASTVADIVPASKGTQTGEIKVDWRTTVSTESRVAPVTGPVCSPSRSCLVPQQWATTNDGITVRTERDSAARVGADYARSVGALTLGTAGMTGKLRSYINNSSHSSAHAHANANANATNSGGSTPPWDCSDPDGNGYCYP